MKKILLDTNAYTRLLAGEASVLHVISAAETVYVSVFVLGELYAGFKGGTKESENKDILRRFLSKPGIKILNATLETAEVFGYIKFCLKKAGTPLPINDLWIAAHAKSAALTLVTNNEREFKRVSGLKVQNWVD